MNHQTLILVALTAAAVTSGCASTQAAKLSVCDGRHRRPANPNGSVLPTVPLPALAPAASNAAPQNPLTAPPQPPTATPPQPPGPLSKIDPKSWASCGRLA